MTTQEFLGIKLWCMTRMALEPENLQAETSDDITKSMHETFFTRFLKANSYKCLNYKKITHLQLAPPYQTQNFKGNPSRITIQAAPCSLNCSRSAMRASGDERTAFSNPIYIRNQLFHAVSLVWPYCH